MTNPLHAPHYADSAVWSQATVTEHVRIARDTYRLRFSAPEMARRFLPGQFLMLRLAGWNDPLLGRPLALYDTVLDEDGHPAAIDVVYLVMGKMTSRLAHFSPGEPVEVWGPLGNGFAPQPTDHLIMVAGGIGQTPFPAVAREALGLRQYGCPAREPAQVNRVSLCYGARSAELLAGVDDFERLGVDVHLATDDGSAGHHGLVTELLENLFDEPTGVPRIVCCGPEPMMEAVTRIAAQREVPCRVSLETPMACGIGICFTCVAKVKQPDGQWDYKRTCVEGPVFEAERIVW